MCPLYLHCLFTNPLCSALALTSSNSRKGSSGKLRIIGSILTTLGCFLCSTEGTANAANCEASAFVDPYQQLTELFRLLEREGNLLGLEIDVSLVSFCFVLNLTYRIHFFKLTVSHVITT